MPLLLTRSLSSSLSDNSNCSTLFVLYSMVHNGGNSSMDVHFEFRITPLKLIDVQCFFCLLGLDVENSRVVKGFDRLVQ